MAKWSDLKAAIAQIIKTNGNQEITGRLLQNVLNNIVSSVGENSTFAGIATPSTNPGTPDGPVFYLAAFQEQTGLPTNVVLSAEGQTQRLANVQCGSSNCLAIYSSLTVTITPAAAPAA